MSFILKALKKVEEEKAARQRGEANLNSAILSGGDRGVKGATRLVRWGVVALVFLAGSSLTYLLMQRMPAAGIRTDSGTAGSHDSAAPAITSSSTPPRPAAPAMGHPPVAPDTPPAGPQGAVTTREANPEPSPPRTIVAAPEPSPKPAQQTEPGASSPPGLKVNGIALQDDPYESVAVVNGVLAKRGMIVEGVRVEEIFQDRVRFSGKGGQFDVQLSR